MTDNEQSKTIGSVERAFSILDVITELEGAKATEIAEHLDTPVSTTYNHLETLRHLGWTINRGGEYYLSTKFYRRGLKAKNQHELCEVSEEPLRKLSAESGEHTSLMIEECGLGVFIHIERSSKSLRTVLPPGTRTLLHSNAPGKTILAFLNENQVRKVINRHGLPSATEATMTEEEELFEQLYEIRRQQYAIDQEEGVSGLQGVAMPILKRPNREIMGAISIYTPSDRNITRFKNDVIPILSQAKNTIEINFLYS